MSEPINTCHEFLFKKSSIFPSIYSSCLNMFFTCCDPRVCGIVRMLYHCSVTASWKQQLPTCWSGQKRCLLTGMNSSTLNDPFQPPRWRDCGLFDLICLICCHFIVCNFFYLAVCVLMFCPCMPCSSGRCETSIKWRNKIHSLCCIFSVGGIHSYSFLQLFLAIFYTLQCCTADPSALCSLSTHSGRIVCYSQSTPNNTVYKQHWQCEDEELNFSTF